MNKQIANFLKKNLPENIAIIVDGSNVALVRTTDGKIVAVHTIEALIRMVEWAR